MTETWKIITPLLLPVIMALSGILMPSQRSAIIFCAAGTLAVAFSAIPAVWTVLAGHAPVSAGNWLIMDALSAFHICVMMIVFSLSAIYAVGYFKHEIQHSGLKIRIARRYTALWFGAMAAMFLVMVSNNLVMMWVGIEATTILTAFLICIHPTQHSIEAMWKYLLMCSVGVAMAFIGTLLIAASTSDAGLIDSEVLMWTKLMEVAPRLNTALLKAGFIFIVVGYGTKAGLAPMHNWLPDAHSQAPSPVSAVFSGFLLNTALFCILKFMPIVNTATGDNGWAGEIMIALGIISVLISAIFIPAQTDVKRMLAYCSVEHIGLIAIGAGLGGIGYFAALLHTLNHSLAKMLAFFSAGRLGQIYKTHDMTSMTGTLKTSKLWGLGLTVSMLSLIGVAPFSLFLSEFLILKAAYDAGAYITMAILLVGLAVIFIAILRHIINMTWHPAPKSAGQNNHESIIDKLLVFAISAAVLITGLWIPSCLDQILRCAAEILEVF